ncbi:putative NTP pyrophosphohydrolase, NUDIX family [Fodinibius salinus]|uniref:Putative NTP pyrophosphohydrolase, NUDIX family n=1 Tax=Fodinibius salinus TaxID=860790 RepID=A0A5D3YKN0_9BACT|nr:NUDIX domain-containing protein [Fodinibius salinus]TYP94045.1 putative NTP pyrophosphohydrolase, NUDIX family [Fodinibius salinus]
MSNKSAGILLFKRKPHLHVLLAHPGGPYWWDKDEGAWSIPKGEVEENEELLEAAKREFDEELGFIPDGDYIELGSIQQKGGKTVHGWAVEYQIPDDFIFVPNEFELEWPPESGQKETFPEIDRIEYFGLFEARKKINTKQRTFLNRLLDKCT